MGDALDEHALLVLLRDPWPRVFDGQDQHAVGAPRATERDRPRLSELQRVGHQVGHDLAQLGEVTHGWQRRVTGHT